MRAWAPDVVHPSVKATRLTGMAVALSLVESATPRELRARSCTLLRDALKAHARNAWTRLLFLEECGRWLGCDGGEARLECDDFRHPYAHAIRQGKPLLLGLAEARSRLDHEIFQSQVAALPGTWRLALYPLRALDGDREWLGVLALASEPAALDQLRQSMDFAALTSLLCRLWAGMRRHRGERQRQAELRDSLDKLSDSARRQTLAERLATDLLGSSSVMQAMRSQIVRVAETQLAVLLQGETGTGKDCVARAIHRLSARGDAPFMAINCAAIPESLLESELFGHAKGAFSGADQASEGLIAQANGGTLFLDEIGDMPLALQAKLLRVLESGRYRPLGASEERRADLRLVAATHQPLRERIRDQRFRADLYYRLGQFPLSLPPLRERRDDIAELAEAFIQDFCRREAREPVGIARAALRRLHERDFPGNVRELRNLVDYACAMTRPGEDIEAVALPEPGVDGGSESAMASAFGSPIVETARRDPESVPSEPVNDLRRALRDFESEVIRQRLLAFGGNRALAAESLGLPKRTLAHKCRQLELNAK